MPRTPKHSQPERRSNASPSSYLSAELGALGAFLKLRTPLAGSGLRSSSAAAKSEATGPPQRVQIEADLAERARGDAAFKTQLLADPTATVARTLQPYGVRLLDTVTVHVHEESPFVLHLVLPIVDAAVSDELDDALLDLVAGGASGEEGAHTTPFLC